MIIKLSSVVFSDYVPMLLVVLCLLLSMGCGDSATPEDEIKKLIQQAEKAAEEKNVGDFRNIVSEKYRDDAGRVRKEVIGLLRYYFLRNKKIYVLTRIKSIEFPASDQAEVTVLAAVAGKPVNQPENLKNIRADLHRIDFTANKAGDDWKVTRAAWSRAMIEDFSFI